MNEAAERYSPEIAEAFQPTETDRPATKKSPAVREVRADQKPMAMVAMTVIIENASTQPSKLTVPKSACISAIHRFGFAPRPGASFTDRTSSSSSAIERRIK